MARITIIPSDNFIAVDGVSRPEVLDFSSCSIPADVHALQWYDTRGWIEFVDEGPFVAKNPNQDITELPAWANACVAVHAAWTPPAPPAPDTTAPTV
jgi:hypothetical protein